MNPDFNLASLGRTLTDPAEQERMSPVYGRDARVQELADLVAFENSVILVGSPGSGKTALLERLSQWIASDDPRLPVPLKQRMIVECDHTAFQAYCTYVHDFETRFRTIINKCRSSKAFLLFDNVHLAAGAGAVDGNEDRTLANMLMPYLGRRDVMLIGTTTPDGYQALLRRSPGFAGKFVKWNVDDAGIAETIEIVRSRCSHLLARSRLTLDDAVIQEVVHAADRFYPSKAFPGKAFDILYEAASRKSVRHDGTSEEPSFPSVVTSEDVFAAIQRQTGLDARIVCPKLLLNRQEIVECLQATVFEQDEAVEALTDAILMFKVELTDPDRPVGVFLFAGPTGVGKTELARQVARYVFGTEKRLVRYDMSEYGGFDGIRGFLGDRKWGSQRDFVGEVMARPFSVILLDEIEKATREVQNLLLQAFGDGRLTDARGRTAYLANTIFILTSNLTADLYGTGRMGFSESSEGGHCSGPSSEALTKRMRAHFAPEFLNRITKTIHFRPLSLEAIRRIAKKELVRIAERRGVRLRNLKLRVTPKLDEAILARGFHSEYGARPVQRAVRELVIAPLTASIAAGEVPAGSQVELDWDGHSVNVALVPAA